MKFESDELTEAELKALEEHFQNYVSGPGYNVLKLCTWVRRLKRAEELKEMHGS